MLLSEVDVVAGVSCRCLLLLIIAFASALRIPADEFPRPVNTQAAGERPPSPQQMLDLFELPDGFRVTLFAGEPDVQQPIAFDFDDSGRIWVAENYTYSRFGATDAGHRDRIVILEDTDHDGQHDIRKVFWDQGSMLTSLAWGFGGLWILNDGTLAFLPDRNGDDIPDGEPEIMLNGWTKSAGHNFVNGLMWGPDGWLYGRHGIKDSSLPGTPDTPREARLPMNCGVWRFHPSQHVFEVVCRGTTNPWGMDYDSNGNLFMTNNVIGHLWHVIPGGHYERMFGQSVNPHLYELMKCCSDHYHWDTTGKWTESRDGRANHLGGGHSHCGGMIYYGRNFPSEYQGKIFMCNTHGRCVNIDRLERSGGTFVAKHEENFLTVRTPWFRGIELKYGPRGYVYLSDWSDNGECHDNDGVHRTSGRIYRISFADSERTDGQNAPANAADDEQIDALLAESNVWHARRRYRRLMELAADEGLDPERVRRVVDSKLNEGLPESDSITLAWLLKGLSSVWPDTAHEAAVRQLLASQHASVRAVAVQLLAEDPVLVDLLGPELVRLSRTDTSPTVHMSLASALQRLPCDGPASTGIAVACGLAIESSGAAALNQQPQLRRLIWYGLERGYQYVDRWDEIADHTLRRWYVRRWASEWDNNHRDLSVALRRLSGASTHHDQQRVMAFLQGLQDGLRGLSQVRAPLGWQRTARLLMQIRNPQVNEIVQQLSVTFGDGTALAELRKIIADRNGDHAVRSRAVTALAAAGDEEALPLLLNLLTDRAVYFDVAKALAAFDDPAVPKELLKRWKHLRHGSRDAAIDTLCSRLTFAQVLVRAIEDGRIDPRELSASQVRQLLAFQDPMISNVIESHWGSVKPTSAARAEFVAMLMKQLTDDVLASADRQAGAALFKKTCAGCHKLYGQGASIGPDLTGANRGNLPYLLQNIVDPGSVVPRQFTVSVIALHSGLQVTGVVVSESAQTITVQTEKEQQILGIAEIAERRQTSMSLMPNELLSSLSSTEIRDLIAYVMNPG